jgi:hypothetical protein
MAQATRNRSTSSPPRTPSPRRVSSTSTRTKAALEQELVAVRFELGHVDRKRTTDVRDAIGYAQYLLLLVVALCLFYWFLLALRKAHA